MNHFSRTTAIALVLSTVFAFQAKADFKKDPSKLDKSWITDELKADAMKMTRTTSRDLVVYSYLDRSYVSAFGKSGKLEVTDAGIKDAAMNNVTDRMSRFWDITKSVSGRAGEGDGAMAPNGLYVATEPVISRTYGNVMYRMVLPQGLRYIDGRSRNRNALSPALQTALAARGCTNPLGVSAKNPLFTARNLIKADTAAKACRQALMELADATDVKAVLYIFNAEPVPFCKNIVPWNSAFVLVDPSSIKEGSFQPFAIGQSSGSADDGLEVERAIMNGVFTNASLPVPFPNSKVAPAADAEKYMTDNYMSCSQTFRDKEYNF